MEETAMVSTSLPENSRLIPTLPIREIAIPPPSIPKLAKALADAQKRCKAAVKDAYNKHHDFWYASAESIITEAKLALAETGLSPLLHSPRLKTSTAGNFAYYEMVRRVGLAHESGEFVYLDDLNWPLELHKGLTLATAFAIAITTSLSYFLRDLLLMPRIALAENQDAGGEADDPSERSVVLISAPDQQAIEDLVKDMAIQLVAFAERLQELYGTQHLAELTAEQGKELLVKLQAARQSRLSPAPSILPAYMVAWWAEKIEGKGPWAKQILAAFGVESINEVSPHWLALLEICVEKYTKPEWFKETILGGRTVSELTDDEFKLALVAMESRRRKPNGGTQ